jgi:hypothetical protein
MWFWDLLGVIVVIAWIVGFVDMVRRRGELPRGRLAAWICIVVILPIVGTILYFAVGRRPAE